MQGCCFLWLAFTPACKGSLSRMAGKGVTHEMLHMVSLNRMFFCWLSHHSAISYYHESVPALHKLAFCDRLFCVLRGFITTQRIIHPLLLFGFRIANILTHALMDAPCHWLWCVSHHDLLPRASLAWFCYHQLNHSMPFPNTYPMQMQTNATAAPIRKLIIFHPFIFQPTAFPV